MSARHNNNRNSSSSVGKMIRAFIFDAVTARALPKSTVVSVDALPMKRCAQPACVRASVCVCRASGREAAALAAVAVVVVVVAVVFFLCFALT